MVKSIDKLKQDIIKQNNISYCCENPFERYTNDEICKSIKKWLKKELTSYPVNIVRMIKGYGYCSFYLKKDNNYLYLLFNFASCGIINEENIFDQIMYRTVKNEYDYNGGRNMYCDITELVSVVDNYFKNY